MLPDLQFRHLGRDEWQVLRDMRLNALHESPLSFLAKYDQEKKYGRERWQNEFDRGDWIVGELDARHVCLTGVTREADVPADERYLEYVWVAQGFRQQGIAFDMLTDIISELKDYGVRTVFLWTLLKDNDAAQSLYERLLFITTCKQQKLESDLRGRLWECLRRDLI
jgi:ribosomal protein S18 acetylase RimI-like enzyme